MIPRTQIGVGKAVRKLSAYIGCLALLVGNSTWSGAVPAYQEINLHGQVVTTEGSAVPGVEVYLKGQGSERATLTDDNGEFSFEVSPGRFDLVFQFIGFYTTIIKDVKIEKQPLAGLTIFLQPRLRFDKEISTSSCAILFHVRRIQNHQ